MPLLTFLKSLIRLENFALIEATVLMILFLYNGHGRELSKKIDPHRAYQLHFLSVFILFFIIPLITLLIYRQNPIDYGLKLGNWRTGILWVAAGWVLAVIVAIFGSRQKDLSQQYPFSKEAMKNLARFVRFELMYLGFYYIGWEFFFRGFLLFTIVQIDPLLGILVQVIPSVLLHIGHPASESWGAVIAGIIFGYLAYTTGSILYPLLIHAAFGIFLDTAIYIRYRQVKTKDG